MKALQGPPHLGKSLIPQPPANDDVEMSLKEKLSIDQRVIFSDHDVFLIHIALVLSLAHSQARAHALSLSLSRSLSASLSVVLSFPFSLLFTLSLLRALSLCLTRVFLFLSITVSPSLPLLL